MTYQEITLTAFDGLNIFLRTWTPERQPRAVLIVVHGLGEHAGRYQHVITHFSNQDYVIFGHDHRGFGHSGGKRGDFNEFDDLLRDLDQVVELARQSYPDLPLGFYAHSLGGMIATHYLARYADKVGAAVISSPGYGPGPDYSPTKIALARVLARIVPGLSMQTGSHEDEFTLSQDPDTKAAYDADEIYHHTVTIRFANTCLRKADEAGELLASLSMPVLVIMAENDTTINRQAILNATSRCENDVTFRQYTNCLHEMHNELPDLRDPILQEAVAWMNQNLALS